MSQLVPHSPIGTSNGVVEMVVTSQSNVWTMLAGLSKWISYIYDVVTKLFEMFPIYLSSTLRNPNKIH